MSYKIAIITGSVRKENRAHRVALFLEEKCNDRGWETTIINPADHDLPLIEKQYSKYEANSAPDNIERLHKILEEQDGFLVATAEYNHSIPPALSNLIDYFWDEYFYKPAGIVSYSNGGFGGVRAAVQARILLGEVGMTTIPTMFPISVVQNNFDENGKAKDEKYNERIVKFLNEFEWYVEALKIAREKGLPKK